MPIPLACRPIAAELGALKAQRQALAADFQDGPRPRRTPITPEMRALDGQIAAKQAELARCVQAHAADLGEWTEVDGRDGVPPPDIVAVHMAMLHTGKVLLFSGDEREFATIDKGKARVWDPVRRTTTSPALGRNLFCCGHCQMPDGRIFVAGGQSTWQLAAHMLIAWTGLVQGADRDVHLFDPGTNAWFRQKDMPFARWYPTCTVMPDGNVLITSGLWAHTYGAVNEDYEIFNTRTLQFDTKQTFLRGIGLYPFQHVLPGGGGTLFVHSRNTTRLWDIAARRWLDGQFTLTTPGTRTYPGQGACVLLPLQGDSLERARLLMVGGSTGMDPGDSTPATRSAEIFEFDSRNPARAKWRPTASLSAHRFMSDATLLADGTVFVSSGAGSGKADHSAGSVRACEVFDPATEGWLPMADAGVDRLYHSTAVLLPDARVVVAGSTGHKFPPDQNESRLSIFTPPYLKRGPRPTIEKVSGPQGYGRGIEIFTPDVQRIRSIGLVRLSTVTHTNNMDQRFVGLPIAERLPDRLKTMSPRDATIAPPGWYMLFILDMEGVPSMAKFMRIPS